MEKLLFRFRFFLFSQPRPLTSLSLFSTLSGSRAWRRSLRRSRREGGSRATSARRQRSYAALTLPVLRGRKDQLQERESSCVYVPFIVANREEEDYGQTLSLSLSLSLQVELERKKKPRNFLSLSVCCEYSIGWCCFARLTARESQSVGGEGRREELSNTFWIFGTFFYFFVFLRLSIITRRLFAASRSRPSP